MSYDVFKERVRGLVNRSGSKVSFHHEDGKHIARCSDGVKVNGVVVHCSDCINHMVSIDDAPCKNCWKAICHTGDISSVCLDDIAFYPKDKEHFLAVEKIVKKYRDQFTAMKTDAKAHGVSIEELCKQYANRRTLELWVDGIQ